MRCSGTRSPAGVLKGRPRPGRFFLYGRRRPLGAGGKPVIVRRIRPVPRGCRSFAPPDHPVALRGVLECQSSEQQVAESSRNTYVTAHRSLAHLSDFSWIYNTFRVGG